MIKVVGMGVYDNDISLKGYNEVNKADFVYSRVKTKYNSIPLNDLIEKASSFDELDRLIADRLNSHKDKKVVYLVYGDGYGDSVIRYLDDYEIIPCASEYRGRQPSTKFLTMSAYDIEKEQVFCPQFDTIIYQVDDALLAGDIKLALLEYYDPMQEVTFSTQRKSVTIPLEEIDRQKTYNGGVIFIKGENDFLKRKRFCLTDLLNILNRLTAPDGCPWDKVQTHQSIRTNMIEEAYEAVEAVNNDDLENLIEELGDVLLQVVFNSDIAKRTGEFTLNDVITRLCDKLISRHTHIFGDNKATDEESALKFWEQAKAKEKHYDSLKIQLERLPKCYPATLITEKCISKSIKGGFNMTKEEVLADIKDILSSTLEDDSVGKLLFDSIALCVLMKIKTEPTLLAKAQEFVNNVLPIVDKD